MLLVGVLILRSRRGTAWGEEGRQALEKTYGSLRWWWEAQGRAGVKRRAVVFLADKGLPRSTVPEVIRLVTSGIIKPLAAPEGTGDRYKMLSPACLPP